VAQLKETLRTKNEKQARLLAPPVLIKFDRRRSLLSIRFGPNCRKLRSNRLLITSMPMNSVLTKSSARGVSAQTRALPVSTNS
jgi:hypothetical protein